MGGNLWKQQQQKKVVMQYKGKTKLEFSRNVSLSLSVVSFNFGEVVQEAIFFQIYLRPNFKPVNNNEDVTYFVMSRDYHDEVDVYRG